MAGGGKRTYRGLDVEHDGLAGGDHVAHRLEFDAVDHVADLSPLEHLVAAHGSLELRARLEHVVDAVDLAGARLARRVRDRRLVQVREAVQQLLLQRALPDARRAHQHHRLPLERRHPRHLLHDIVLYDASQRQGTVIEDDLVAH